MKFLAQIHPPLPASPPQFGLKAVRRRGCHGFTLMEILMAMLVVALGILGVVAMNVASIKMQADSANRALAGLYAQDILERMRANKDQAKAGSYNLALNATPALTLPASLAQQDLSSWFNNLKTELPSGSAVVNVNSAGDVTVTMGWFERQNRGSDAGSVSVVFSSIL